MTDSSKVEAGLNPTQLAYTATVEDNLSGRILEILSPVFGRENVRATVTADMSYAMSERTDEFYKPNGDNAQATIRSQQTNESREGDVSSPNGIPGVLSNTPPGQSTAPAVDNGQTGLNNQTSAANTNANGSLRRDSTVNYEVDKTIQHTREQVGKLQRISAAVVVNHKTITDNNGEARQVPLTQEEMTQVDQLVRQAIGFNADRGDQVNVVNQKFAEAEQYDPALWEQPEAIDLVKSLGLPIGVALVAAILVFGLFKPMLKPLQNDAFDSDHELLPKRVPLLPNEMGNDVELLEQLEREGSLPGNSPKQVKLERLRQLAKDHPQIVANIVKNWVNGEAKNA